MTLNRLVVMAIALFLSAAGMSTAKAPGQSNSQPLANLDQNRDVDLDAWDTPPKDLSGDPAQGIPRWHCGRA